MGSEKERVETERRVVFCCSILSPQSSSLYPQSYQQEKWKVNEEQRNTKSYSDLVKFGVLLLIFAVVILVVSLVRPLIFGRIVPAVMGNSTTGDVMTDGAEEPEVPTPETDAPVAYPGPTDANVVAPEEPCCGDAAAYPAPDATQPITETSAAASQFITHTLQPGENLTKVAEQYGVTVADIVTANALTNPDSVQAGTALRIPVNP